MVQYINARLKTFSYTRPQSLPFFAGEINCLGSLLKGCLSSWRIIWYEQVKY